MKFIESLKNYNLISELNCKNIHIAASAAVRRPCLLHPSNTPIEVAVIAHSFYSFGAL
jgi:hypothetical protein